VYFARYCSPGTTPHPSIPPSSTTGSAPRGSSATSAASSTPCSTCSTRASSPRCCATWVPPARRAVRNLLTQGMVIKDGAKMSKSKGNVVDPRLPGRALRGRHGTPLLSLPGAAREGPRLERPGVEGMQRFLHRLWRLVHALAPRLAAGDAAPRPALGGRSRAASPHPRDHPPRERRRGRAAPLQHRRGGGDGAGERPRRCERANQPPVLREAIDATLLLLAPFVPHIASELWRRRVTPARSTPSAAGGRSRRARARADRAAGAGEREAPRPPHPAGRRGRGPGGGAALADPHIQAHVAGRPIRKVVFVPGRMLNLIV